MRRFPLIHAFSATLIDHALAITHDYIAMRYAHCFDQFRACNRGSACAITNNLHILKVAPGKPAGIDEPGRRDDCGAMLVIMENRDVHLFAQRLLDHKAVRCRDIFQIDAAKGRFQKLNRIDEAFRVLGLNFNVDRIDVGKALEQHRLAFHDRFRGKRAKIAHSKDRGTV